MTTTDTAPSDLTVADEGFTFAGLFPLTEDGLDMTQADLVREAESGPLADLLVEVRAELVGEPEWKVVPVEDGTLYLSVEAPAQPWTDRGGIRGRDLTKLVMA